MENWTKRLSSSHLFPRYFPDDLFHDMKKTLWKTLQGVLEKRFMKSYD